MVAGTARGRALASGGFTLSFKPRYLLQGFRRAHWQARSFLAMVCLSISLGTLMQVLALEEGSKQRMLTIMEDTGNRNLTVNAGEVRALPNRGSGTSIATTLNLEDYASIVRELPPITGAVALSSGSRTVEFQGLATQATVTGVQPDFFRLRHFTVAQGRLPDALDERDQRNVAVIGAQVAGQLFGKDQESVLAPEAVPGQTMLIGQVPFVIIGVLQARGSGPTGISEDDGIYIPLSTALRRVFNIDYLDRIIVEVADIAVIPALRADLIRLLRSNHRLKVNDAEDFTLLDATLALGAVARNQEFTRVFFRGLALLTLSMAGTGIFALNHLNVKERDNEFGLRKALGARTSSIAFLVLAETLVMGIAGGVGGTVLGLATLLALQKLTDWDLAFKGIILLQLLGVALILSMVAALIPAWQAATKEPIAALQRG